MRRGGPSGSTPLHLLPSLVLLQVCDTLGVADILALASTNKVLHGLLHSCLLLRLHLPVPEHLEVDARTKRVLSLSSSCNLLTLPGITSLVPLHSLNLSKLKELSLIGNNHVWNKQYLLTDQYKRVLGFLLSSLNSASIKKLEFLTDESLSCVEVLDGLTRFPNLEEVVAHGIGYFNLCSSYHMDKEIAQKIINKVLCNTRLKVLRLKSFQTINRCVIFESPSLERLDAELGKSFEIGLLSLPNAREISIDTSMWYGCFYHAQNGDLKKIVAHGCPSLENLNGIDLAYLAQQSGEGHAGDWLGQLRQYSQRQIGATERQCGLCTDNVE